MYKKSGSQKERAAISLSTRWTSGAKEKIMSTRNNLSAASYAMHVAAKQNANLSMSKMSAYTRYILFVIGAIVSAISAIATAACATLVYTGVSATWEMKMYAVALAAITITSAAMAFFIANPLRVNLIIFDQFRAMRGENLSLGQILGMAYDYAEVEEKYESIPQLIEKHERLKTECEKLAREIEGKKTRLADIDNRIAIDLAYDACRCEIDPTDIIGQLDQLALEASSAREALRAFNAAGDKDSLVLCCCKAADRRLRPILASWYDFTDEEGESRRGVVFYDTRGRSITLDDLYIYVPDDWRQVHGKWVCSASRFTGYAKGDPYGVDAFGRPQHYHSSSRIDINDAHGFWLDNGIAAASEQDFVDYAVIHKRLVDDWQEKNRRWNDAIKANSTPDLSLPTTTDQE